MELFNTILLIIIGVVVISSRSNINQKFVDLEFRILELQNLLKKSPLEDKPHVEKREDFASESKKSTSPSQKPVEVTPERPKSQVIVSEPVTEKQPGIIADNLPPIIMRPVKTGYPESPVVKEPQLSFFERYPDLEKFIGENLVNKIGIAILVLAIAFFVKYAIDNNWVGPIGRVGIGILCGAILLGFAHRMRNSYNAFSSVLVGGGIAIFYFTITLAYQEFHLSSQSVSLAILVIITVFAVLLSLLYDKQELAIIALIGGFASPFMVSNGNANYNGLFIYLLILNIGLLAIAYYKAWRVLNISSFVLSVAVFATVLFNLTPLTYIIGFKFACIFYLLFFSINIINNVRENRKFLSTDFTILLVNTALFFAAGLCLLTLMHLEIYRGLFSASLGALNLVLSFILFKNRKVDPNVLFLLIGITLTFISLTAPIQLHGNNITLFWASEAVLLYWLYKKSGIKLMKLTSLVIWIAMFISLLIDIIQVYGDADLRLTIIANKGFITMLFATLSCYLLFIQISKDKSANLYGFKIAKDIFRVTAFVLLFLSGGLEINHQFSFYYVGSSLNIIYVMLYITVFVSVFKIIANKVNLAGFKWQIAFSLVLAVLIIYLALIQTAFNQLDVILMQGKYQLCILRHTG